MYDYYLFITGCPALILGLQSWLLHPFQSYLPTGQIFPVTTYCPGTVTPGGPWGCSDGDHEVPGTLTPTSSLAPGAEVLTLPSLLAVLLHLSFKIYFHFFLPIHTPTTPNTTAPASWLFPFLTNDLSTVTVAPLCWYLLKLDLESKCGFMERWVRHFFSNSLCDLLLLQTTYLYLPHCNRGWGEMGKET